MRSLPSYSGWRRSSRTPSTTGVSTIDACSRSSSSATAATTTASTLDIGSGFSRAAMSPAILPPKSAFSRAASRESCSWLAATGNSSVIWCTEASLVTTTSRARFSTSSTSCRCFRRTSSTRGWVASATLCSEFASTLAASDTQSSSCRALWWNWWRMVICSVGVSSRSPISDDT